jgi:protein O-GlcNAc transferase
MKQACADLQANRLTEAETNFRALLAERPTVPDALHLLGCTLCKLGNADEAVELIRRAVRLNPKQPVYLSNLGLALLAKGSKREAIGALSESFALEPNQPHLLNTFANALSEIGEYDQALALFHRAIEAFPREAGIYYNLANCWYRKACRIYPGQEFAGVNKEELRRAIACFHKTLEISPKFIDAMNNLGNTLRAMGQMDEAIATWRRTVGMGPHAYAYYNLGRALYERDQLDDAREAMESCLRISPKYPDGHNNFGNLLRQGGKVEESIAEFNKALELEPDNTRAQSNRLYTLYYHPGFDAKRILEEHRHWNDTVAKPLASTHKPHENDRSPDRRLRIGYFSPNFWGHCQSFFTLPLFANHDRENFEIYCYSDVKFPDATTARLRGFANSWKNTVALTEDQIAEQIRVDRIDILVDLTLHMAENRMLVFARKRAPIQATWLGYPGTTGLSAMDYRLTDPYLDPPGKFDEFYTEASVRLPHTFWCIDVEGLESPEIAKVNELPAEKAGHITFGCLNNFCKVNQPLLEVWKRVLDAVPNSKMLMLAPPGFCRAWVKKTLGDRVDFVGRANRPEYMKYYHRIDIGLDTLPYNGHTTTLDSLWMGVPVVTMTGETVVGRAGFSQLSNLGLTDLSTSTPDEFVKCAADLAGDLSRLIELRRTLRDRMKASPLLDGKQFARDIEAAYRSIWKTYCRA